MQKFYYIIRSSIKLCFDVSFMTVILWEMTSQIKLDYLQVYLHMENNGIKWVGFFIRTLFESRKLSRFKIGLMKAVLLYIKRYILLWCRLHVLFRKLFLLCIHEMVAIQSNVSVMIISWCVYIQYFRDSARNLHFITNMHYAHASLYYVSVCKPCVAVVSHFRCLAKATFS